MDWLVRHIILLVNLVFVFVVAVFIVGGLGVTPHAASGMFDQLLVGV
jgi:hypothetical protein